MGRFEFDAYPISTLSAPSGVTNIGGANVYAAKLATGGMVSVLNSVRFGYRAFADDHCIWLSVERSRDAKGRPLTCYYPCPPDWILEV